MEFQIICQLLLAAFLGALIGVEREYKGKKAGLQTYTLVAIGACLFTIISLLLVGSPALGSSVVTAIAIGMGFIGAGAIFRGEGEVQGLTTAAGLWVTAAIALAVGAQFYFLAITATFLTLIVFAGFGIIEEKLFKK